MTTPLTDEVRRALTTVCALKGRIHQAVEMLRALNALSGVDFTDEELATAERLWAGADSVFDFIPHLDPAALIEAAELHATFDCDTCGPAGRPVT